MGAGFDGAPILAGGERHRIDAVENALVVRSCAIGIGISESIGFDDPLCDRLAGELCAVECRNRDPAGGPGLALVAEIGEDAQQGPAPADRFQFGRERLAGCVHGVGPHCITRVQQQMHDEHGPGRGILQLVHLQIEGAAAQATDGGVQVGEPGQEFLLAAPDAHDGRVRVGRVQQLNLPDHHWFGAACLESAASPRQTRGIGHGRHHRWLFDHQGQQVVAAIDDEVGGDGKGQGVAPDHVLHQDVSIRQCDAAGKRLEIVVVEFRPGGDDFLPALGGIFVKAFETAVALLTHCVFHRFLPDQASS